MVYEFAIEPKLVASWADRENFLFFDEKFSIKAGRIYSGIPKSGPS